jgi:hypothetical protein
MDVAKMMKKRKDEMAMKKEMGGLTAKKLSIEDMVTANTGTSLDMSSAKAMKPMASSVVSGILKEVKKSQPKDANAVTEIDGEVVKWKAGKNPAYEEKLMKLKKKK